jgi:hypothetical protein
LRMRIYSDFQFHIAALNLLCVLRVLCGGSAYRIRLMHV